MKQQEAAARRRQNLLVRAIGGIALIVVGVALVLLLRPHAESNNAPEADEWSVRPAAVRYPAPELSLVNIDGETNALSNYRQQVVLVNNWAIWCPPCKAEMPTLASYYEDHTPDGLMIIAIEAGGSRNDVLPFIQTYGLKFQVWLDPQKASMAVFRNQNLPSSYVIDRTGIIRFAWTGAISRAMLETYVTPLLTQSN